MKLEKLELSALLGIQSRHRELTFMLENVKLQLENLDEESKELFSSIEKRLKLEPNTLEEFDLDAATGELLERDPNSPLDLVSMHTQNGANGKARLELLKETDVDKN